MVIENKGYFMFGFIKKDLKRIVALILTVVMIIPMNVTQVKAAGYVTIDETFGTFLKKYSEKHYDDEGKFLFEFENTGSGDILTSVSTTSIESATSLTIDASEAKDWVTISHFQNLSDLSKFTNLKSLTIIGLTNIQRITFPSSLTSLTMENCTFTEYNGGSVVPCVLDVSGCENLEELVIKGTTLKVKVEKVGENDVNVATIAGIDTLKKLKKLTLDRTNITSVSLSTAGDIPSTIDNNVSTGLEISTNNCTSLTSVNTGTYRLIGSPSLKECTSLKSLTAKGNTSGTGQTLNISGCSALDNLSISYYFADADSRLTVQATNITKGSGGDVIFTRIDGSPEGLYIPNFVTDSFLDKYKKDHSTLFVGGSAISANASFIVFKQDVDNYNKIKYEFWKDTNWGKITYNDEGKPNNKWRDYEANPIILRVGETIDDDTPHFYAADGTNMDNLYLPVSSGYTYKVFDGKSSGDTRDDKNGLRPQTSEMSSDQQTSYNTDGVISVTKGGDGKLSVTAKNPGIAYLKVSTGGPEDRTAEQKIMVLDTITSMELVTAEACSYGAFDGVTPGSGDARVDTLTFYAKYKTQYPSLSTTSMLYSIIEPEWTVYKKSGGTYSKFDNTTGDGISIQSSAKSNSTSYDSDKKEWTIGYEVIIKDNACGGDYSIRGKVRNEKGGGAADYINSSNNSTDPSKFSILNFSAGGTELAYKGFTLNDFIGFTKTEVDFTMTKGGYSETPQIDGDPNNCLKLVEEPANSGKYKLKFNTAKSPADIAKFLSDKGSNCYVEVVTHLGKTQSDSKTYKKRVYLASSFDVSYDSQGGSDSGNITKYYLPSYYRPANVNEYNFKGDMNLKPVTKDGYEFMGWYDAATGGHKITKLASDEYSLGDLSLYAHWSIQHNITYNLDGGTNNGANPATFGEESEDITLQDPSKSGYEFVGWTGSNGATPQKNVVIPKGTKKDLTYTANWKSNDSGGSSDSGSSNNPAPAPAPVVAPTMPTVPTYVEPGKIAVFEVKRDNPDGTSTTVEVCVDGTVRETTEVSPSVVAAMNATINPLAPTIISNVELVVEKDSALANAKVEKVSTVVVAKTINGNINLSPEMVSTLQSTATSKVKGSNVKNIDVKVNTTSTDGKPLSVVVPLSGLKNNTSLKAYARDPITGGYIMLDVPLVKYSSATGFTTSGLVSGLEYHYVPAKEIKAVEDKIYNSIKVSDAFANTPTVAPGSVIEMRQAISPVFHMANAAKVTYSISGGGAIINPDSGRLVFNQNARKGTYTITIKILLTNGKTKTIKVKVRI